MEVKHYSDIITDITVESIFDKENINLLIGNGFSIAYDEEIFSYSALSTFIERYGSSELSKVFKILKKENFEQIMKELGSSKKILNEIDSNNSAIKIISDLSDELKKLLIQAIEKYHPQDVFSISEEEIKVCANFLSDFLGKGKIFATNYDLLLYWVLVKMIEFTIPNHKYIVDGFGSEEGLGLLWGKNNSSQNIFYLHGALHLFDTIFGVIKEEYSNSKSLISKIRDKIKKENYPLFVTASNSEEKLNFIKHNPYLSYCYNQLSNITGYLITFGFNFGEYDEHIIDAINHASKDTRSPRLSSIYISTYSDEDKKHIEEIQDKFKCKLCVFDAKEVDVWKKNSTTI